LGAGAAADADAAGADAADAAGLSARDGGAARGNVDG
jgi:hypothetical protein